MSRVIFYYAYKCLKYLVLLLVISLIWARFLPIPTTFYMMSERAKLGEIKRDWIDTSDLRPEVYATIIASEDSGFCNHSGVEWGVLFEVIRQGGERGGSTISQQTVKNLYLWHGKSRVSKTIRKAIEIPLTLIVDLALPKERILEIYLNIVEFDAGVFGIEAAALHHFGVSADALSSRQIALLTAVLPNPKGYSAVPPGNYVNQRAKEIEKGAQDIISTHLNHCLN